MMAAAIGWYAGSRHSSPPAALKTEKILYYQSPMHPWIKSDKPGNCTICGMKLSPVFEGEKGADPDTNVVVLGSNSVTVLNVQSVPVTERPLKRTIRAAGIVEDDDTRHRIISAYVAG